MRGYKSSLGDRWRRDIACCRLCASRLIRVDKNASNIIHRRTEESNPRDTSASIYKAKDALFYCVTCKGMAATPYISRVRRGDVDIPRSIINKAWNPKHIRENPLGVLASLPEKCIANCSATDWWNFIFLYVISGPSRSIDPCGPLKATFYFPKRFVLEIYGPPDGRRVFQEFRIKAGWRETGEEKKKPFAIFARCGWDDPLVFRWGPGGTRVQSLLVSGLARNGRISLRFKTSFPFDDPCADEETRDFARISRIRRHPPLTVHVYNERRLRNDRFNLFEYTEGDRILQVWYICSLRRGRTFCFVIKMYIDDIAPSAAISLSKYPNNRLFACNIIILILLFISCLQVLIV